MQMTILRLLLAIQLLNQCTTPDPSKHITLSNPLVEGIAFQNNTFNIVGVCVDPINNGLVTYVPIETLENITGLSNPNLLLVTLNIQLTSLQPLHKSKH